MGVGRSSSGAPSAAGPQIHLARQYQRGVVGGLVSWRVGELKSW
jgi:hypothetical protein